MLPKHCVLTTEHDRTIDGFVTIHQIEFTGTTPNRPFEARVDPRKRGTERTLEELQVYEFEELFQGPWGKAFANTSSDQLFGTGTLQMTSTTKASITYSSSRAAVTCEALKWRESGDAVQRNRKEGGMAPKEPEILAKPVEEPDEWAFVTSKGPVNQKTTHAYVDSGCTCSIFTGPEQFIEYKPSSRIVGSAV
jgi:hypothetical protein